MHPDAAVNRVTLLRWVVQAKRSSPCDRRVDRLRTAAAGVCWVAANSPNQQLSRRRLAPTSRSRISFPRDGAAFTGLRHILAAVEQYCPP
jgi:hypothetical protein